MKTNIVFKYASAFRSFLLYSLSLSIITVLNSCNLEEKYYSSFTADNYFTDLNNFESSVLRGYYYFQNQITYGEYIFTAFDNDTDLSNLVMGLASSGYNAIAHYNFVDFSLREFNKFWEFYYANINSINFTLERGEMMAIDESNVANVRLKKKLIAEAKFLRAVCYFDLVRYFGDVPLKTKSSNMSESLLIPRTPKEYVYDQIVRDLEEAIPDLPWYYETKVDGRATKNSALGMLARVELFRGGYSLGQNGKRERPSNYKEYYQKVLDITSILMANGKNALEPSYEKIFRDQCMNVYNAKENLFEIDMRKLTGVLYGGCVGASNAPLTAKGVYNLTVSRVRTQALAYNKFESIDLRRNVSIATFTVDKNGVEVPIPYKDKNGVVIALNSENFTPGKWRRSWQDLTDQFVNYNMTSVNFVVLRYSDVLLMRAEALNEINEGPTPEAELLINQVRRRGYGVPIETANPTVDMPTGLDKNKFVEYLQDERARELMFEGGIRRLDLIRWNILGDKVRSVEAYRLSHKSEFANKNAEYYFFSKYFRDNVHELYPIPEYELRQNPAMTQNPGYSN